MRGRLDEILSVLEAFVLELNQHEYGSGETVHIAATRVAIDPILPLDLFAYGVCRFDEQNDLMVPDGSEEHPMLFAVNRRRAGVEQVQSFLSLVLSALYRLPKIRALMAGTGKLGPGLQKQIAAAHESAREESDRLLRAAQSAGNMQPITNRLRHFGQKLRFEHQQAVRPNLQEVRAAMRFCRDAYNELEAVRNAIDNVTSLLIGAGPRLVGGGSELVRTFAERRLTGMGITQMTTQSFRDMELFGTSCIVIGHDVDVSVRLIRPDKIRIERRGPTEYVIDESTNESWPTSGTSPSTRGNVVVMRGIEQDHSPYGLSVLDPILPTVYAILTAKHATDNLIRLTTAHDRPDADAARSMLAADEARKAAEAELERLLRFPTMELDVERGETYFPGWDLWKP